MLNTFKKIDKPKPELKPEPKHELGSESKHELAKHQSENRQLIFGNVVLTPNDILHYLNDEIAEQTKLDAICKFVMNKNENDELIFVKSESVDKSKDKLLQQYNFYVSVYKHIKIAMSTSLAIKCAKYQAFVAKFLVETAFSLCENQEISKMLRKKLKTHIGVLLNDLICYIKNQIDNFNKAIDLLNETMKMSIDLKQQLIIKQDNLQAMISKSQPQIQYDEPKSHDVKHWDKKNDKSSTSTKCLTSIQKRLQKNRGNFFDEDE